MPRCGSRLSTGQNVRSNRLRRRVLVFCSDPEGDCAFSPRNSPRDGLPVLTVDEEIYRLTPSLVIATVDKLAQLPWKPRPPRCSGSWIPSAHDMAAEPRFFELLRCLRPPGRGRGTRG